MKAILVIDVPVSDDGRHICNDCPIWNKEHRYCVYDKNLQIKGKWCPLKPMPQKEEKPEEGGGLNWDNAFQCGFVAGWNACLEEIEK